MKFRRWPTTAVGVGCRRKAARGGIDEWVPVATGDTLRVTEVKRHRRIREIIRALEGVDGPASRSRPGSRSRPISATDRTWWRPNRPSEPLTPPREWAGVDRVDRRGGARSSCCVGRGGADTVSVFAEATDMFMSLADVVEFWPAAEKATGHAA